MKDISKVDIFFRSSNSPKIQIGGKEGGRLVAVGRKVNL